VTDAMADPLMVLGVVELVLFFTAFSILTASRRNRAGWVLVACWALVLVAIIVVAILRQ